jgi:hypothetical protein
MAGYNIFWIFKIVLNILNGDGPGFDICVREITQIIGLRAFHKASGIKDFSLSNQIIILSGE